MACEYWAVVWYGKFSLLEGALKVVVGGVGCGLRDISGGGPSLRDISDGGLFSMVGVLVVTVLCVVVCWACCDCGR